MNSVGEKFTIAFMLVMFGGLFGGIIHFISNLIFDFPLPTNMIVSIYIGTILFWGAWAVDWSLMFPKKEKEKVNGELTDSERDIYSGEFDEYCEEDYHEDNGYKELYAHTQRTIETPNKESDIYYDKTLNQFRVRREDEDNTHY